MSWQAQTAVRKYGQIRETNLLYFALYLAEHASPEGCIDPAPNQEAMAAEFRVSTRTVRSWLAKLVSLEVVEQTRIGSGPGRASAYTFLLPMPEKAEAKVEKAEAPQLPPLSPKMEAKPASTSTFTPSEPVKVEALQAYTFHLEQKIAEMTQKLEAFNQKVEALEGFVSAFITAKVEGKAEKGGSPTGENEPSINIDQSLKDLKELGAPLPPTSLPPLAKVEGQEPEKRIGRLDELYDDPKQKNRARLIQELCDFWCHHTGRAKPRLNGSSAKNQILHDDFYTPAGLLLERLEYDLNRAQDLLITKRQEQLAANKTPYRISAVVPSILGDLDKVISDGWYDPRVPVQGGVY